MRGSRRRWCGGGARRRWRMCGGARRWRGPGCLRRRWMSHRGTGRWATAAGAFMLTDFRADLRAGSGCRRADLGAGGGWGRADLRAWSGNRRTGFIARSSRRIAGTYDPVTLWLHRRDRLARMRRNSAWTFKLRGMRGRSDRGMAVIVVERKRRIFRRRVHVVRLLGRRRNVTLFFRGKLLGRWLRCRSPVPPL